MTLYRIRWKGRPWGQIDMRETLTAQGIRRDDFTAQPKGAR